MTRIVTHNGTKGIFWDFSDLYGGTLIFPGSDGYLKMGNCLMSYGVRGSNALIKFDNTDSLQIKYANHGSTMTLNTQGTAYSVCRRYYGEIPVVQLFMKLGMMAGFFCFMHKGTQIKPISLR